MSANRKVISRMEVKFIENIIKIQANLLQVNYSVCSLVDSSICSDYDKI